MLLTHPVLRKVLPPTKFTRHLGKPEDENPWHRLLEADGEMYCGDFNCNGSCGLPKLVRKRPADCLPEGYVIEQASALLGVENVWSSYRWNQSLMAGWDAPVVLTEYTEAEPYWF